MEYELKVFRIWRSEAESQLGSRSDKELRIHMHTTRWSCYPTCSVQLQDITGAPKSKAWEIRMHTSQPSGRGPEMHFLIWHDVRDPYAFPAVCPPVYHWYRCKLTASEDVIKGAFPSLSDALQTHSYVYATKMTDECGLTLNDRQVLALAINQIGDGKITADADVKLPEPPWVRFLQLCRDWGLEGRRTYAKLRYRQRRAKRI
jgi:hypothetical protein